MGGGKRRGMEEEVEAGGTSDSMTGLCDETQSNAELFGFFKGSVGSLRQIFCPDSSLFPPFSLHTFLRPTFTAVAEKKKNLP